MLLYMGKRCLQAVIVLLVVSTLVFFLLRVVGDPATLMLDPNATKADYEDLKRSLGLDQPIHVQYVNFMKDMASLNLGRSYRYKQPVVNMIKDALPFTLQLVGVSLLLAVPLAIVVGVLAAVKRNSLIDSVMTTVTIAGRSIPSFWLGLILMMLFAVKLKILPPSGWGSLKHLILPSVTLAMGLATSTVRMTRNSMLSVMNQDYMKAAKAKGVSPFRLYIGHGLRNSLISVITLISIQVGHLLGGSIVVETVFSYPGIGRLLINAIMVYDYPVVQASVVLMALLFVVINLVVDLLYSVIDPRIRVR